MLSFSRSTTKKSILFVDDDPNVVTGIRRMLRRNFASWDLRFARSGDEALALMAEAPADLIVTDIRMPGMLGTELLKEVLRLYPSTARIVLSGYADQKASVEALKVAHQFLAKPCDPAILKDTIQQTLRVQDLIQSTRIRKAMGEVGNLPSLPSVYQELNSAIQAQTADAHTVAAIFAKDMALSARLLQLVNSSFFGLARRVSNLSEAVMLIGVDQLKNLVLRAQVFETLCAKASGSGASVQQLFENSLRTAELALRISRAESQTGDRLDQAYLGGLMCKLGLLIFAARQPEKFKALCDEASGGLVAVEELETRLIGVTHPEAGAYILGLWNLPPRIVESVLLQNRPSALSFNQMCAVTSVHAASALLRESHGASCEVWGPELDMGYLERIGLAHRVPEWRKLAESVEALPVL